MAAFKLEEKRVKREIQKRRAKVVLIQLPEGLKQYGSKIAKGIQTEALPIISADPCYGACDLALDEAAKLGADLVIHYGHTKLACTDVNDQRVPVLYIETRAEVSIKRVIQKAYCLLQDWDRIGLVTTIQHVDKINEVKNLLEKKGINVEVGNSKRFEHAGQIIGCDFSNAKEISKKVDAFLFLGGGKFHAIGVSLSTGQPTIIADPYEKRVLNVEKDVKNILKKRAANIEEAKSAENFGIIIGLKTWQKRLDRALKLKGLLESYNKKITVFAMREITSEALSQFPSIDAFVNTACPRLFLETFKSPVITPQEALVVLGHTSWETLCRKGWFES